MGAKRRKMQEKLVDAEMTIERLRESIEGLRADNTKLRNRPTVAKLPEGDQDVYTVIITDVRMERDMLPVDSGRGFVKYYPGVVTISLVCTGPQPANDPAKLSGVKFALIPVQDPR